MLVDIALELSISLVRYWFLVKLKDKFVRRWLVKMKNSESCQYMAWVYLASSVDNDEGKEKEVGCKVDLFSRRAERRIKPGKQIE